jgi:hypothetical protein
MYEKEQKNKTKLLAFFLSVFFSQKKYPSISYQSYNNKAKKITSDM